jgi:hypothetical protein
MSKIVKAVLIVAVAAAIVVFAPQIAAFIGASGIFGATVTAATLTALTSAAVGIGLSLGLTAAMGLFRKVPNLSASMAERLSTQIRPTAARRIVFGLTAAGSDVRFEQTHDLASTKKDGQTQIVALASHRINAVKLWQLEDIDTWNGGLIGKYAAGIPMFRIVTEGKTSNAQAIPNTLWGATAKFTGCAYYAVTFKLDADIFPQNPPIRRTTVVEGCPVYDPRLDSSTGGSGSHRANNQATWTYYNGAAEIGRNPALSLLTYMIGYRIADKLAWGMGIPVDRINLASFRTYANVCEERVTLQAGGSVQRYTFDGIFSTSDSHDTIINAVTAAMGSCKLVDNGGVYSLIGGYDDTMGPKVSLTSADILTGGYSWDPAPSQRDTYNIARGQFCDASLQYQLNDWGEIRTNPLADGYDRTLVIDLGGVTRAETAQRIAKQHLLREAKTPGVFAATFGPKAFAAEVGGLVTLSGPENWNNKLFRVLDQAETHDMIYQMTLREESAEVYGWDREEKPLPASIRPPGYDPSDTISPANLAATSTSQLGANSINISVVDVTWTPELSGRVTAIEIQSRTSNNNAWTALTTGFDPKQGAFRFQSNAPGVSIQVQARFRMSSGVVSPWVSISIDTQAVIVNWASVDGPGVPEDYATLGATLGSNVFAPDGTTYKASDLLTSQGTAADVAKVSGRSASQVITDLDGAIDLVANEVLEGANWRGEKDQIIVMPDGTSVRQYAQGLGFKTSQHEAYISQVTEVGNDGSAKALLSVRGDGKIAGMETYVGGLANPISQMSFVAENFLFVDNSGGNAINAARYQGGVWKMPNIEVDTLKVNTAIIPTRAASAAGIPGTFTNTQGTPNPTPVLTTAITMTVPGWIECQAMGQQAYSGTNADGAYPFIAWIEVNGVHIPEATTGGAGPQNSWPVQGTYFAATPGTYTVTLCWGGITNITLNQRSLFVKGYPRTI